MERFFFVYLFAVIADPGPVWADELRDVKPPVEYPANYFVLIVLLGLGVIGLILWVLWYLRNSRIFRHKTVPPLLPWELALQRLKTLGEAGPSIKSEPNRFYTELSDIVRRYIEDRFEIRAPEMTTEEFLNRLRQAEVFSAAQKELLREFLQGCDMAKFARYSPAAEAMEQSLAQAKQLVSETIPVNNLQGNGERVAASGTTAASSVTSNPVPRTPYPEK